MQLGNNTFIQNNKTYVLPEIFVPNSIKYEYFLHFMRKYNYIEFMQKFDKIYNKQLETKPICYYIKLICEEYTRLKRNGYNLHEIIRSMQNRVIYLTGRRNSRYFHVDFIPMVCIWRHYKVIQNNRIQFNNSIMFNYILNEIDIKEELSYGYVLLIDLFNHYLVHQD